MGNLGSKTSPPCSPTEEPSPPPGEEGAEGVEETEKTPEEKGDEWMAKGEQHMMTGFFRWKPDCELGINSYLRAGDEFKKAKHWSKMRKAYLSAAEIQRDIQQHFFAAKSVEQAAAATREMGNLEGTADLLEEACAMYLHHEIPAAALLILLKAGRTVEEDNPERAISIYMKGIKLAEYEKKFSYSAEMASRATRLYIQKNDYENAAFALRKEMQIYASVDNHGIVHRLIIGMILLHLTRGEYPRAAQELKDASGYAGFAGSKEAKMLERLLAAYREGDAEAVHEICQYDPIFRYLECHFAKLGRELKVPAPGEVVLTAPETPKNKKKKKKGKHAKLGYPWNMD